MSLRPFHCGCMQLPEIAEPHAPRHHGDGIRAARRQNPLRPEAWS